jgi:hypothetical protein
LQQNTGWQTIAFNYNPSCYLQNSIGIVSSSCGAGDILVFYGYGSGLKSWLKLPDLGFQYPAGSGFEAYGWETVPYAPFTFQVDTSQLPQGTTIWLTALRFDAISCSDLYSCPESVGDYVTFNIVIGPPPPPTATIVVNTNPQGLKFTADNTTYTASQTFHWVVGSTHTLSAGDQTATGARYAFTNWSQGGPASQTIAVPSTAATYNANFSTQYLLGASASPATLGTITPSPASADGYYASGASVQLTAAANQYNQFTGWSGDLNGTTNPQTVVMSAPRNVTAKFAAQPATFSFSTNSSTVGSGATNGSVNLSVSPLNASWTAASNASWLTPSPTSGTGSATISYTVAANLSTKPRQATIAVGAASFTVNQAAAPTYSFNPTSASVAAGGASGTVSLTVTPSDGTWTASSNQGWLHITSANTGAGSATINYSLDANTTTQSRTGTITVGAANFTVTQAADSTYGFSPTSASVAPGSSSGTVSLTVTPSSGTWTASSNQTWLHITSAGSGTGSATISYSVDANNSAQSRTGTITAGAAAFGVTQAGAGVTYSFNPTSTSVSAASSSGTVSLTVTPPDGTWTASSNQGWLHITSAGSGTGTATINYSVDANTSITVL